MRHNLSPLKLHNFKIQVQENNLVHWFGDMANKLVQLNQYETAPYFLQLGENLTLDCLLIYLNFPEFPSSCMM